MQILYDYIALAGITQTEMGKRLGMTPMKISILLNGKRKATADELVKIHQVTGIELDLLILSAAAATPQTEGDAA
jgi:transcriptional regulator with XRE-family HTH domain